jgi:hypothetical protein
MYITESLEVHPAPFFWSGPSRGLIVLTSSDITALFWISQARQGMLNLFSTDV